MWIRIGKGLVISVSGYYDLMIYQVIVLVVWCPSGVALYSHHKAKAPLCLMFALHLRCNSGKRELNFFLPTMAPLTHSC